MVVLFQKFELLHLSKHSGGPTDRVGAMGESSPLPYIILQQKPDNISMFYIIIVYDFYF